VPTRASFLAGFSTSISPTNDLRVGVVTATGLVGNVTGNVTGNLVGIVTGNVLGNITGNVTGTVTGLTGTPNLNVGVVTATSFSGDGSGLTGVGVGASDSINTTGIGTFSTIVVVNNFDIPEGTYAERPVSPAIGSLRYNTEAGKLELYDGSSWVEVLLGGLVIDPSTVRGVFGGGSAPSPQNTIDYITIATTGNATDFGDLTQARSYLAACSSSTRGVFGGGFTPTPTSTYLNTIDYITIATTGNATDFGDLTLGRNDIAACSSSTRGVFGGGNPGPSPFITNTLDYITIATTGNATDFGDLTAERNRPAACSSFTRGVFGGGYAPSSNQNVIDYITIASTGNATDFGDLTVARQYLAACSSSTRGVFGGGYIITPTFINSNTIDYITIATTGNATDFGDLTVARTNISACSSSTRGVFGGGNVAPTFQNVIDYITIATTGNATDFGDLTVTRGRLAACSNGHGGL
jgi:hypothetical protein